VLLEPLDEGQVEEPFALPLLRDEVTPREDGDPKAAEGDVEPIAPRLLEPRSVDGLDDVDANRRHADPEKRSPGRARGAGSRRVTRAGA